MRQWRVGAFSRANISLSGSTTRGFVDLDGVPISARAQERILNGVVTRDVRGAAIEAVCVQNQQPTVPASIELQS